MQQLGIEGIGQQLATLTDWKTQNNIFTHKGNLDDNPWCAWDEIESPVDFLDKYGGEAFGYGPTEKEAILNFCDDYPLGVCTPNPRRRTMTLGAGLPCLAGGEECEHLISFYASSGLAVAA